MTSVISNSTSDYDDDDIVGAFSSMGKTTTTTDPLHAHISQHPSANSDDETKSDYSSDSENVGFTSFIKHTQSGNMDYLDGYEEKQDSSSHHLNESHDGGIPDANVNLNSNSSSLLSAQFAIHHLLTQSNDSYFEEESHAYPAAYQRVSASKKKCWGKSKSIAKLDDHLTNKKTGKYKKKLSFGRRTPFGGASKLASSSMSRAPPQSAIGIVNSINDDHYYTGDAPVEADTAYSDDDTVTTDVSCGSKRLGILRRDGNDTKTVSSPSNFLSHLSDMFHRKFPKPKHVSGDVIDENESASAQAAAVEEEKEDLSPYSPRSIVEHLAKPAQYTMDGNGIDDDDNLQQDDDIDRMIHCHTADGYGTFRKSKMRSNILKNSEDEFVAGLALANWTKNGSNSNSGLTDDHDPAPSDDDDDSATTLSDNDNDAAGSIVTTDSSIVTGKHTSYSQRSYTSIGGRCSLVARPGVLSKVLVLLIRPSTKSYEMVELNLDIDRSTVADLLTRVPTAATKAEMSTQLYIGLCRPTNGILLDKRRPAGRVDRIKDRRNSGTFITSPTHTNSISTVSTDPDTSFSTISSCETETATDDTTTNIEEQKRTRQLLDRGCRIVVGEILIAIPKGFTSRQTMTMGKVILEDSNLIKVLARKRPLKMPTSRKQNDLKHCMRRLSTREAAKRRSSARVRKSMSASSLTSTPVKDGFKAVDKDAVATGISEELLIRSELAKLSIAIDVLSYLIVDYPLMLWMDQASLVEFGNKRIQSQHHRRMLPQETVSKFLDMVLLVDRALERLHDGSSEELLIRSELAKLDPEVSSVENVSEPETSPRKTFDYNYMVNPYKNRTPTKDEEQQQQHSHLSDTDKFFHLDEPSEL
eukprot:CAMPEP_0194446528 /NCGR_PEP_ID=MMETSP0176-20130528/128492_1 /TAXON_ID=216777 /ORGANISM="Proboscia alata, Strain PI-D3" /LENGTH=865 /DNA_ID=CAMNT_0039273259 /DNA_START=3 /DNA_END=2602 /DNA_ORIENTATION=-